MINIPYISVISDKERTAYKEEQEEQRNQFKHLYIDDNLVSSRITWTENRIKVQYYKPNDFPIPWYKQLFSNNLTLVNQKNEELWQEASAVTLAKHLIPPTPPLNYVI
jgi:hypothetical protein